MAERDMTMVFCYDISSAKQRDKMAGLLEDAAVRVQRSVFEVRMSAAAADRLFDRLQVLLEPGDSLRMYALSKAGLLRSRTVGGAPLPEGDGYWLL